MKTQIKFRPLDGIWSKFYDVDNIPEQFKTMKIDAVIVQEEMTVKQYETYIKELKK